ncbi:50S ribosomal protein L24 [Candidatus Pacearchaeota archaeon]|nr:50S ribosomal protein L24 [Candidatus Pacearchaeota archaeon]
MKSEFSTAWKSSIQPRKQHKYRHNAPLHIKHRFLSAHLSKDLRKKYSKRNLPLRKGDEVLVMRGAFKKKKAKVASVDHASAKVALEGIQRTKRDGTKVSVVFNPRALQIISLNLDDKRRISQGKEQIKEQKDSKPGEKNASN